jgi:phosphoribosylformylglycinamidine synthase
VNEKMTMDFKSPGDIIYLVGVSRNDIHSSEYLHKICKVEYSPAPHFNLEEELQIQQIIATLINKKLIESAHDVSEGGLFVTLLEGCFNRNVGVTVKAADKSIRKDAYWFGEAQSRVVVSVKEENRGRFEAVLNGVAFEELGEVVANTITIDGSNWGSIADWKIKYDTAIENLLAGHQAEHAMSAL